MFEPKVDTSAAEAYESALVPGLMRPWAEAIVAQAGIALGMRVLDVACGTGIATRFASRLCGADGLIVGVDGDAGMIETAKIVATKERVIAEYRIGTASDLPFASASFDVALCLQGLQYFPDRSKAMTELRRVLKRDAKLAIATWGEIQNCKGHWAIVAALERRSIDASSVRHPFSLSDGNELRSLADDAGFKNVTVRTEQRLAQFASSKFFVDAMVKGATSSRLALAKVPPTDWPAFLSEVETELAPWKQGTGIVFPMESNILEARC